MNCNTATPQQDLFEKSIHFRLFLTASCGYSEFAGLKVGVYSLETPTLQA